MGYELRLQVTVKTEGENGKYILGLENSMFSKWGWSWEENGSAKRLEESEGWPPSSTAALRDQSWKNKGQLGHGWEGT